LAKMVRVHPGRKPCAIATRTNAELLALSGPHNPYPGKLGVVGRRARRSAVGGRRPCFEHQAAGESSLQPRCHHEGRQDLSRWVSCRARRSVAITSDFR